MKPIAVTTLFFAMLLALPAAAEEADLTGTWVGVSGFIRTTGGDDMMVGDTSTVVITIASQNGPVFSGSYGWVHPERMQDMHDGEKVTHESEETFVGVIHHDGKTISLADHPDTGFFSGALVDANSMELVIEESGPYAIAGRITFARQ
ncbi:MAG: hypothetical protein AAF699_16865 [Pseudomonadota bacterium]